MREEKSMPVYEKNRWLHIKKKQVYILGSPDIHDGLKSHFENYRCFKILQEITGWAKLSGLAPQ